MRFRRWPFVAVLLLATAIAAQQGPPPPPAPPSNVASSGMIAAAGEPGEKLVVSGRLFAPDGKAPASGVIVYAYQTDATGEYHNNADRIARLHGWTKSDAQDRFEFHTIRPGPYPGRTIPAHIHIHVWGAGYPRQWTPDVKFADDPLLSARDRSESDSLCAGFANICEPKRAEDGVWHCAIRLRLQRVTNYPAQ